MRIGNPSRADPDVSEAREAASRLVTDVTRAADIISKISLLFKKPSSVSRVQRAKERERKGHPTGASCSLRGHAGLV